MAQNAIAHNLSFETAVDILGETIEEVSGKEIEYRCEKTTF